MALIVHVGGVRAQWWQETLQALLPEIECRVWEAPGDKSEIEYAVVWRPPAGELATFPNLKCIFSIGAGVDHVLCDPDLPDVPIVRLTGPELTQRMTEYVALHVLRFHRRLPEIEAQQARRSWNQPITPPASQRRVGILGLGVLGQAAAVALVALGFNVAGWARTPKTVPGVTCFHGRGQLPDFLKRSEILVCLLPLTPETENILNRDLFTTLPQGAYLIHPGRGEHLVEADLLTALDRGHLAGATLDVFRTEPLPPEHPFWAHPRILVTPHTASLVDPDIGGRLLAEKIRQFRAQQDAVATVDRQRGY